MIAPFICYCIFAVIASFGLIFNNLLFIIAFIFYIYLCAISCRLYKLIKDAIEDHSNQNDVRRYEEPPVAEQPVTVPVIEVTRPRTPVNNSRPSGISRNETGLAPRALDSAV